MLLDWVGNNGKPYEIPAWLASSLSDSSAEREKSKSTPIAEQILSSSIYTSQPNIPLPLLRKMAIAAESERPISIVRQRDKKQICINRPMETLLATPAPQACERIMTNFWRPRDLEELERKYRQEGTFTWRYEGGLNEATWAILEARFERFEGNDGNWYGFVTNFYSEPIPYPEDMRLLRQ